MNNLTSKELMYIEDLLDAEAQEVKKFQEAANQCTDPQAQALLNNIASQHQQHFNTLNQHLQQSNNNSGQTQ